MLNKYHSAVILCVLSVLTLLIMVLRGDLARWIVLVPIIIFLGWIIYGASVMSANFFIESKCSAEDAKGTISITFDDGPLPGYTDRILELLKRYQIKAVFFCIGKNIALHPLLAQRIIDEGHLICNHSYYHSPLFSLQSTRKIVTELKMTENEIEKISGYRSKWFRPPYGVINPMIARAIKACGYQSIGWSIRSFDTKQQSVDELVNRVTKTLKAGDIVLFHDNGKQTIEALPLVFEFVAKCGLKIERADYLLKEKASF